MAETYCSLRRLRLLGEHDMLSPGGNHPLAAKEMSPASRSKPKDKSSARTANAKEQKSSLKVSTPGNTGAGAPASAYNPLLGTFHTLETAPPVSSPPPHSNGRFRNIDETDEHSGSSVGTGAEYDSVSNNDSCSGESEDLKEKMTGTTLRQEAIPGSDNDKREKIRQKNERKHQRQRERRTQELHERCNGYLMSRKLEALSQQLVAMGFSFERATMALIANEGRIEESVAWLLEGGEEAAQQKDASKLAGVNLKIDITEELSRIVDMELKYKCSKQEVERAIVACEGDLEKASENLKTQKQEPVVSTPKTEEAGEPSAVNGGKLPAVSITQNPLRPPAKPTASITIQPRRDERDFNYTKVSATVLASPESANRNLQALRRTPPKSEWTRPQVTTPPAEKRWLNSASNPSVSYSLVPPLQVASPAKPEAQARFVVVGSEVKNLPSGGTVREPVIVMQRPQSINAKQNNNPPAATTISASPPGTAGWYPNGVPNVEMMKSNTSLSFAPSTRNLNPSNNFTSHQFYQQPQYQPFVSSSPMDSAAAAAGWGGSGPGSGSGSGSGSWSTTGTQSSSSLAVPSSLGLFSGWGSSGGSGSSSPVDWSTGGSMPQCDYTNIDWTLESTAAAPSSNTNGWWLGLASLMKNSRMYDSWSLANQSAGSNPSMLMRSASPNGGGVGGVYNAGLQEGVPTMADNTSSQVSSSPSSTSTVGGGGSGPPQHEWTSPFGGKDIFSLPRQYVTSPSL